MKKLLSLLLLVVLVAFSACNNSQKEKPIPVEPNGGIGNGAPSLSTAFAQSVEQAHNKEAFMEKEAISFDILLYFNGKEHLNATFTMKTNSSKIKMETKEGTTVIYDGEHVFISPPNAPATSARFDVLTFSYFMAMPFKLTDPGTQWGSLQQLTVNNIDYSRAKLTFKDAIGDSPKDWYIIYVDNKTNLLSYASYIVTYGNTLEKAEENPHAIVYANYIVLDDIALADQWKFYNWSEEKGLYGDPIGEATLSNIKFVTSADFTIPENAVPLEAPKSL